MKKVREFIKKKRVLIPVVTVAVVSVAKLCGIEIAGHDVSDLLNAIANLLQ
jgi:uncharacterized membrane protein